MAKVSGMHTSHSAYEYVRFCLGPLPSSPSRTPPHVWSRELNDATTSRRCCVSCIGCLSVNESSTRLHAWYTSLWLVRHPHTSPTTSNSLRTVIAVSYVQPTPGHASFHGRTTSAIEVSMLQAGACGTVYHRTYKTRHELRARVSSVN